MKHDEMSGDGALLKKTLDALYATRSQQHLQNDPLSFCHRYRKPEEQEVAGLIASSFAYGNVKSKDLYGFQAQVQRLPRSLRPALRYSNDDRKLRFDREVFL